jgi:hypothetical protein
MGEDDGLKLDNGLSSHVKRPSWWTDGKPVIRRFETFERLDGVVIAVELDGNGRPVFVALFPDAPIGRHVVLEERAGLDEAWLEVDRRWPPSPWMVEQAGTGSEDGLDMVENGIGFRLTFHGVNARALLEPGGEEELWDNRTSSIASPTVFDSALTFGGRLMNRSRAPKVWQIETDRVPYERFRIAALEIQIDGRGSVLVDSVNIGGGINLIRNGGRTIVGAGGSTKLVEIIRDLRAFPDVNGGNSLSACIVVDGDVQVSVAAIMKTLLPVAQRTPPFAAYENEDGSIGGGSTGGGFVRSGSSYG